MVVCKRGMSEGYWQWTEGGVVQERCEAPSGTPRCRVAARAARSSTVGSRKASVLPLPVRALAMTSCPARASGSVFDCTSVHSVKCRTLLMARLDAAEMGNSANVVSSLTTACGCLLDLTAPKAGDCLLDLAITPMADFGVLLNLAAAGGCLVDLAIGAFTPPSLATLSAILRLSRAALPALPIPKSEDVVTWTEPSRAFMCKSAAPVAAPDRESALESKDHGA